MTGVIGMVDEDMVWEELAVVELEDGLGLLEVGVVTFVGIISLFFFALWWQDKKVLMYIYPPGPRKVPVYMYQFMGPMPLLFSPSSSSKCHLPASGSG